jgi:2'-5' RNA ligase
MRLFIAVNLDENLRQAIAEAEGRLRASGADVKWVAPESIHITLKFLGWVDDARIPEVRQALAAALHGATGFRLALEGIGSFPTPTAPRVVWVGVKDGREGLAALAERVEAAMEPLGFEREARAFSPHVTIGRCKSPQGRERLVTAMREERDRQFGEMEVRRVDLMRSDLRPTGPIYTSQREFDLASAEAGQGEGNV